VGEADLGLGRVRHRGEARVVEIAACNRPPITSQRACNTFQYIYVYVYIYIMR
jgi:hypothetical protein